MTAFTIALGVVAGSRGRGRTAPACARPPRCSSRSTAATAELLDAATGQAACARRRRRASTRRAARSTCACRTAAWDPGTSVVRDGRRRRALGQGGRRLRRARPGGDRDGPGGAAAGGPALFNMAFRTNEPVPHIYDPGIANTIAEGPPASRPTARGGASAAQADVARLGRRQRVHRARRLRQARAAGRRRLRRPAHRPHRPHLRQPLRLRAGHRLRPQVHPQHGEHECTGRFLGQLQPYALYVPAKPVPEKGFGLVISMHGLSANYNEFLGSHMAEQLGERGARLDRRLARGPRARRQLRELRRGRRLRDVGRRRAPLRARPGHDRHHRLLDGRRRDVPARRPVAGPLRARRSRSSGRRRRPTPSARCATSPSWRGTRRPTSSSAPR